MSLITDFVKELRNHAVYLEDDLGTGKTCDLIRKAADAIEELSAKVARQNMERSSQYYGGGWIPAEDRLPETQNGNRSDDVVAVVRWFNGDIQYKIANYSEKYGWNTYSEHNEVIAWQPLPPAYEPKEDKYE